mmetsp:Transcript_59624/g.66719  ORF Transcript_59624/g.66719 Transcript_59624/m.66719 type:complete len:365 (-) Transcript_59624:451-1545(-)
MSNDLELVKPLIDDDVDDDDDERTFEDIELQKSSNEKSKSQLVIATAILASSSTTVSPNPNPNPKYRKGFSHGSHNGRKNGCPCWCKCIGFTVLAVSLLFLFVLGCASVWLNGFVKEAVEQLTVETPSPQKFDIIEMSDLERKVVTERVMLFVDELAIGTNTDYSPLVLTQDEINGFIGHSDYLRGNMMISFHDNLIEEEYSLPMDVLGYTDRYFVATDYLKLVDSSSSSGKNESEHGHGNDQSIVSTFNRNKDTIEMKMTTAATHEDWFNGPLFFGQIHYLMTTNKKDDPGETVLSLFLEKGSLFGQNVPQKFVDEHQNLLEYLYDNADDTDLQYIRNVISGIESVSIEEGRIIVNARHNSNK